MKIVVINGSPAGCRGASAQYVQYLQQQLPRHRFQILEVAREIHKIERDEARFETIVEALTEADAVIWCTPVYLMLIPAQLKRFIELLFERNGSAALAGKIATAIFTSAHFYDHTAHDYIAGVSCDLDMAFVQGFSAHFSDLVTDEGRQNLLGFARDFLRQVSEQQPMRAAFPPIRWSAPTYDPPLPPTVARTGSSKVVVISDAGPEDGNLSRMIDLFERTVSQPVDRLELSELRMDGGCLGCMRCAENGVCGYQDDYAATFDERVLPADVVIYAGAVRDRYFSARFKTFIDRYFRNGHRPLEKRQAMGFIISGPLQQLATLREILEAHIQLFRSKRLGVVTDEDQRPEAITEQLQGLARAVDRWVEDPWFEPPTFLGVGGMKVFRDVVYENRAVLSADHRYYRDHGLYDFAQTRNRKWWLMTLMSLCMKIPILRPRTRKLIAAGRMRALKQVLVVQSSYSGGGSSQR